MYTNLCSQIFQIFRHYVNRPVRASHWELFNCVGMKLECCVVVHGCKRACIFIFSLDFHSHHFRPFFLLFFLSTKGPFTQQLQLLINHWVFLSLIFTCVFCHFLLLVVAFSFSHYAFFLLFLFWWYFKKCSIMKVLVILWQSINAMISFMWLLFKNKKKKTQN